MSTPPNRRRYHNYTIKFKLEVIERVKKEGRNRVADQLALPRSIVSHWVKNEHLLRVAPKKSVAKRLIICLERVDSKDARSRLFRIAIP
ncbi:hypothetical protein HDV05_007314, partial [Chytridiales sp. JEL 0842]